jgi:transcriptional regulator with XRE-family HTH domain
MAETTHLGKKISRIRELRGMKQETLAEQLGISQQAVSKIEQSESIEDIMLDRVGKVLGITSEGIRKFSEEAAINYFNTFNDSSTGAFQNYHCTFNPLDEIQKLNAEKDNLYKALLKEKDEKIALLERVIGKLEEK